MKINKAPLITTLIDKNTENNKIYVVHEEQPLMIPLLMFYYT